MDWHNSIAANVQWTGLISNLEKKQRVTEKLAEQVGNGDVIGVGSGSTSFLAVQAISEKIKQQGIEITAIPTSKEVSQTCAALGIPVTSLMNKRPDWAFDGADEVDPDYNLIKGRGGAMFAEKLVMASADKSYILVDESKFVSRLGEKFPVPVEVDPRAVNLVEIRLYELGAANIKLRSAAGKDGPVITEAGNFILDVRFQTIQESLEKELSAIPGVIETGLFIHYPVEVISL
ncbi:ribose 5-phosphate isomerase A [Sediminibacillus albus]|uniref:Ribose 5-phosphate isomerase A n=1 Tax=Sediminibacillus albus TaxID=407036 RepID=A0A1G8ZSS7_9BACI|nr:ribose 5-phosphate isomerase A [Sediminibacillus albus]SDK17664.1 ribose 5-phosphate isomerase A [Sediminibacillus albus]